MTGAREGGRKAVKGREAWALVRPYGRGEDFLMVWTVADTRREAWKRLLLHTDSEAERARQRRHGVRPVRVLIHTHEWRCEA